MSYDTKAQKNRPELPSGAALSTLVLEPVEEQPEPAADDPWKSPPGDTERQLPDSDD